MAIAEQRRQFDLTREDLAPWREQGGNALARLGRASTGDMADFNVSPDYNFRRRTEGERDIGNSFAARGGAFSGNAMKALTQFNQNLAKANTATGGTGRPVLQESGWRRQPPARAIGANSANAISQLLSNSGNARASGIIGGNNALMGGLNDAIYGYYRYRNREPDYYEVLRGRYGELQR